MNFKVEIKAASSIELALVTPHQAGYSVVPASLLDIQNSCKGFITMHLGVQYHFVCPPSGVVGHPLIIPYVPVWNAYYTMTASYKMYNDFYTRLTSCCQ